VTTTTTVDLRDEAAAEVRRLANARALLRDGDQRAALLLEGDAGWLALPRRARLQRRLGGRLCLVWRVAFEDASGRLVESTLVPVIVEVRGTGGLGRARDRRVWIQSLLQDADVLIHARVDAACDAWQAEVVRVADAFSSARRRRAADTRDAADQRHLVLQPGLFDRRAERSREAHASAVAETGRLAADRERAIATSAEIMRRPARLLLVIAP
jgi:hypothetical protein